MRLPYFPLHTVVFPHLPLPLHIFEERYRAMAADLLADGSPFGGRFVVAMITDGAEVGGDATTQAIGTICEVRTADQLPDGRWVLLAAGVDRARLNVIDRSGGYATVEATPLEEVAGPGADALLPRVQAGLDAYLVSVKRFVVRVASGEAMTDSLDRMLKPIHLPDDPIAASYAVAGVLQVELARKQRLLELPDAASRLRAELDILRRESSMLRDGDLPTVPASDLGYHPN